MDNEEVSRPSPVEENSVDDQQEQENDAEPTASSEDAEVDEKGEHLQPSDNAMEFFENIDPEDIELCVFDDNLITTSDDGKTLGEFSASVKKILYDGKEVLLVHATSQGKVEETPMGTSITAYLKPSDLSLIKQEHFEYVKVPGHELEKRTEMETDGETGEIVIRRKVIQGDMMRRSQHRITKEKMLGFITEGTNVILQRLLIRSGFQGETMTFVTLDSTSGHLVPVQYKPLPERKQRVGKRELLVTGIERRIMSVTDLPFTWQSYFMDDGHLTMRVQVGSPAIVILEKVPDRKEKLLFEPKPVFEKKPLVWEEDMEMNSNFLQRKEELKAGHETYLREHPEVSALLADFFQFLLLRQPENVVIFAADFFSSFSNALPDTSPYKRSKASLNGTQSPQASEESRTQTPQPAEAGEEELQSPSKTPTHSAQTPQPAEAGEAELQSPSTTPTHSAQTPHATNGNAEDVHPASKPESIQSLKSDESSSSYIQATSHPGSYQSLQAAEDSTNDLRASKPDSAQALPADEGSTNDLRASKPDSAQALPADEGSTNDLRPSSRPGSTQSLQAAEGSTNDLQAVPAAEGIASDLRPSQAVPAAEGSASDLRPSQADNTQAVAAAEGSVSDLRPSQADNTQAVPAAEGSASDVRPSSRPGSIQSPQAAEGSTNDIRPSAQPGNKHSLETTQGNATEVQETNPPRSSTDSLQNLEGGASD